MKSIACSRCWRRFFIPLSRTTNSTSSLVRGLRHVRIRWKYSRLPLWGRQRGRGGDGPWAGALQHRAAPRRPGGFEEVGGGVGGRYGGLRGYLRAVPDADRLPQSHAAWAGSHATGVRPSWDQAEPAAAE